MLPVQIQFHELDHSEAVQTAILNQADKLEKYFDRIVSCHVTVSAPHRRHAGGKIYQVRIRMGLPGGEIVVSAGSGPDHLHEDIYLAVRNSFKLARRQLEDFARVRRGSVKHHRAVNPPRDRASGDVG